MESYHHQIGLTWTESAAMRSIKNMLMKGLKGENILVDFDNFFVPKKWFSFKSILNGKPQVDMGSFSGKNCQIKVTFTGSPSENEMKKFIFGDKSDKKLGGIKYNSKFEDILKDYNEPDGDEDEGIDENVRSQYLGSLISEDVTNLPSTISVIFNFNQISFIENIKPRQMKNPNYIKSLNGSVQLGIDDQIITIGSVKYFQSRFANMNPPKPIKDQIKDMWNKPNKDFGMWGTLAQKGLAAAANGVFGGLFSKTIQEENLDIGLSNEFAFANNTKENKQKEAGNTDNTKIIEDKISSLYSSESSSFEVYESGSAGYEIVFKVDDKEVFEIKLG
jgi:hypothetical protein